MSSGASRRRKEEGKLREQERQRYVNWLGPVRGPIALLARPETGPFARVPSIASITSNDPWLQTLSTGTIKQDAHMYLDFEQFTSRISGSDAARWILNQAELPPALVEEFDAICALSGAAGVYARIAEMTEPR